MKLTFETWISNTNFLKMHTAFYNTTNESGQQLALYNNKAEFQNKSVLKLFAANPEKGRTPSQVYMRLIALGEIDKNVPLTSIRRSITNLTKKGKLFKGTLKQIGEYGHPEFTWYLKIN